VRPSPSRRVTGAARRTPFRGKQGIGYKTYHLHLYFVTGAISLLVYVRLLGVPPTAITVIGVAARGVYLYGCLPPATAMVTIPGVLRGMCKAMPLAHFVVSLLMAAIRGVAFGLAAAAAAMVPAASPVVTCSLALTSADPAWTSRAWNPGWS
jgi:hypothetical protein